MKLLGNAYQHLNKVLVDSSALKHNYAYFKAANPQAQIAPVLKSNAYGHGLVPVAKWLDQAIKPTHMCVDSMYEAYQLHKAKIRTPILIIGYTDPQNFSVWKRLPFSFPVFDLDTLIALNKYQPYAKIHIKVDTGMNRLGLQLSSIPAFIDQLDHYRKITIEGIYSHLSQADDPHKSNFTQNQVKQFKAAIKLFESRGYRFKWKHISATAAAHPIIPIITSSKSSDLSMPNPNHIKDPEFNLIRLGLGFYGYDPIKHTSRASYLKPTLTLTSRIAQIKTIEKGSRVGYSGTWISKKPTKIAILPIGYNDGIYRSLSNKGTVYYKGIKCPIIGRVSMNITIIDCTNIHRARVGDTVEIISPHSRQENNALTLAELSNTIPYDILTNLSESTKRVVI